MQISIFGHHKLKFPTYTINIKDTIFSRPSNQKNFCSSTLWTAYSTNLTKLCKEQEWNFDLNSPKIISCYNNFLPKFFQTPLKKTDLNQHIAPSKQRNLTPFWLFLKKIRKTYLQILENSSSLIFFTHCNIRKITGL